MKERKQTREYAVCHLYELHELFCIQYILLLLNIPFYYFIIEIIAKIKKKIHKW